MSLIPLIFSDWWEDLDRPHRLFNQDFGLGMHPEQLLNPALLESYVIPRERRARQQPLIYYRPWGDLVRKSESGGTSTVQADKDKFEVILDVQQFKPEEISVKVVDRFVVVEGKHEEKQDEHGWISRQFTRRYMVPEQCDIDQVASSLSSDGVLSISAPRKDKPQAQAERAIAIEKTGKPALQERPVQNKKEEKEKKKEKEENEEKK